MNIYTDAFKTPISRLDVIAAVMVMIERKRIDNMLLCRRLAWGYAKSSAVIRLLEDAEVITIAHRNQRSILLKDMNSALNAALRQLRKGNS